MPEKLPEAVIIAVAGIVVVLIALTILMLAIIVLSRLAPREKQNTAPRVLQAQSLSTQSIAAMAVAVALAMEEQKTAVAIGHDEAAVPRPVVSPWAAAGRGRLMRSRAKTGHKWGSP